ncbi:MAG: SprT-like domain-containing protein [Thermoguttaceae bacterium]
MTSPMLHDAVPINTIHIVSTDIAPESTTKPHTLATIEEKGEMSQISATDPNIPILPASRSILNAERRRYALFVAKYAEPVYRQVLIELYILWEHFNRLFFKNRLKHPHLMMGRVPPNVFSFCKSLTDWGADLQITFDQRFVLGGHKKITKTWPAEGTKLLVNDILLHEMIHQYHFELTGNSEPGYRGHGPQFTKVCNEIGEQLGLPAVITRRRGTKDGEKPTSSRWPCNVRPDGYYGSDVAIQKEPTIIIKPRHYPNWAIIFEAILAYIDENRIAELKRMLVRELKKLKHTNLSDISNNNSRVWEYDDERFE